MIASPLDLSSGGAWADGPTNRRLNTPNREEWLGRLVEAWRPTMSKIGALPPIRIACGFPSKRALARNRRVGECWSQTHSGDGTTEIFVSPILDDPFEIAHTVLHELLHAVVGTEHGHRGPFKRAMKDVGLVGSAPSSIPGDELASIIHGVILPELGPYPHAALEASFGPPQSTRLIKVSCEGCGYTIRIARKWIHRPGPPLCPNPDCGSHAEPMIVEWGPR